MSIIKITIYLVIFTPDSPNKILSSLYVAKPMPRKFETRKFSSRIAKAKILVRINIKNVCSEFKKYSARGKNKLAMNTLL
jgi:hypothetical protein